MQKRSWRLAEEHRMIEVDDSGKAALDLSIKAR